MAPAPWAEGNIPGPHAMRLFGRRGNILALARDPFGMLQSVYQAYGPLAALVDNTPPIVVALGPDTNRQLLAAPGLSHPVFSPVARERGRIRTEQWRLPAHGYPALLPAAGKRQQEIWYTNTLALTGQMLRHWIIGRELDAAYTMTTLLFRVVCRTLFGPTPDGALHHLEHTWRRWTRACSLTALQVGPHPLFSLPFRRLQRLSLRLDQDIRDVLAGAHGSPRIPDAAGERLIQHDQPGGTDELIARIVLLLVAGEAAGSALAWTFFLLSQHPQVLADLRDTLWSAFRGAPPAQDQLDRLPLLNDVVDESLRLLPPFGIGYCLATASIELAGYALPPDTTIMYSPLVTHRSPDLYLWPHTFRPERWRAIAPESHQYLPFGAHPDVAAYAPLASMMVRLVLAMVVQYASLGLSSGARIDLHMQLTLMPRGGLPMVIAPGDRLVTRRLPDGNIRAAIRMV
ncbi:MAG TPA: cytochrome P450 [Herpetosiphonaceae bacterium]|nr:cytochrome P450 [Herpetosiphonaceae bacterium]